MARLTVQRNRQQLRLACLCAALVGCGAVEDRLAMRTDCLAEDDYDAVPVSPGFWYGFGDNTPGGLWRGYVPTDEQRRASELLDVPPECRPDITQHDDCATMCPTTPPEYPDTLAVCTPSRRKGDYSRDKAMQICAELCPVNCRPWHEEVARHQTETTDSAQGEPIPRPFLEPVCGEETGLIFETWGHNDWGSGFASAVASRPTSASTGEGGAPSTGSSGSYNGRGYEGISFWARMPGSTVTGVTAIIETSQTAKPIDWEEELCPPETSPDYRTRNDPPPEEHPYDCTIAEEEEGVIETIQADGTVIASSSTARPGDCGNSFTRVLSISREWTLYTLPFSSFNQEKLPNRVGADDNDEDPWPLKSSEIYQFAFRAPKEAKWRLEVSALSFYRKR